MNFDNTHYKYTSIIYTFIFIGLAIHSGFTGDLSGVYAFGGMSFIGLFAIFIFILISFSQNNRNDSKKKENTENTGTDTIKKKNK